MKKTGKWYAFIPNLVTLFNLCSGSVAVYFAFEGQFKTAILLMFAAAVFDFFDGLAARLLKVSGDLGKQLDSLADIISFGLLPGALMFSLQKNLLLEQFTEFSNFNNIHWVLLVIPVLIPAFSALRLAKFNIDTRQTSSFIGLPTPANALFFASYIWAINYSGHQLPDVMTNPMYISLLIVVFSLLMVAEIKLFALKFSSLKIKENIIRYLFLILSLFLVLLLKVSGFTVVILLYIVLSVFSNQLIKKKPK